MDGGAGESPVLDAFGLTEITGWAVKPEGWCRGDECIPTAFLGAVATAASMSAADVAGALGAAFAIDEPHRLAVIGTRIDSGSTLASGVAPDVELLGLDGDRHRLFDQSDGKTLLVTFSSWCGCRYDLPGWKALNDELAGERFDVVAVAIDESAADVEPWASEIDFPVLVDVDRTFADAYGLTNVPTIIWLDEERRVVRQPSIEFSDDAFTEIHGVESGPHLEAVRRWVLDGAVPTDPEIMPERAAELSAEQRQARVEFRLALELLRGGETDAAAERIAIADALAPDDFTIWRAGMKLVGDDPFGAAFFDRYTDWQQRHGGPLAVAES